MRANFSFFRRFPFGNRAFTVPEVMTATAVLALSIVGILSLTSHSMVLLHTTRDTSRANQILQQKMEDLRLMPFSEIRDLPATFDTLDPKNQFTGQIAKQSQYPSVAAPLSDAVAIKITLTVTWTGRDGKVRKQDLSSVFTSTGLNQFIF